MKLGIREYAFLAVLVAVPVSAWFFVFQPRNEDIGQARREITSMQSTLARLDTLTGEVGDVRERIDEAEMRLADFGRIIPNAEEVEDLLAEMHRIADRNRLSIEGDFEGIYGFLSELERLPRLVRVQSLEIERNLVESSRSRDDRPFGMLDAELVLVVYCDAGEEDDA